MSTGHLGFTGTRHGMTQLQKATLLNSLEIIRPTDFHHGDCRGADEEAAYIVLQWNSNVRIHSHPSDIDKSRAYVPSHMEYPPKPALKRNRDIVDWSEKLIAAPRGYREERRSGTWATIRYGIRKLGSAAVIWPDGVASIIGAESIQHD